MKNKIISIALIVLMLSTIFVPLNVFASEDDSIVGTWVFNSTISVTITQSYNIDFTSNNNSYESIGIGGYQGRVLLYLYDDSGNTSIVYDTDGYTLGYKGWSNQAYRTIVITGGSDITNETFITWLKANATKQGDNSGGTPDTDTGNGDYSIKSGKYTLADTITFPDSTIEQDFSFYTSTFSLAVGETKTYYDKMTFNTNTLVYTNEENTNIAYYGVPYSNSGWVMGLQLIIVETDQNVSQEFYQIFNSNLKLVVDSSFVDYNGHILPPLPDGIDTNSRYVFISKINASSVSSELDGKYYYILDVANTEPVVTYSGSYVVFAYKQGGTSLYRYIYSPHDDVVTALANQGNKASISAWGEPNIATPSTSTSYGVDAIVWSAFDIKNEDGTLFFQTPSEVLPTVIQAEILTGVMREIVMILPIGMVCLISYMALRKGLKILVQVLRQA